MQFKQSFLWSIEFYLSQFIDSACITHFEIAYIPLRANVGFD